MDFIKNIQFSDKLCLSSSERCAIFGVNKKKAIDLNALNLIATGEISVLCRCKYFSDVKKHIFEYNLSECKSIENSLLTKQETIKFINSLAKLLKYIRENNLYYCNFAVKPKHIYFDNDMFSFIYVPKVVNVDTISAKYFTSTVLAKIEDDSGIIYDYKNSICDVNDDEIYGLTLKFIERCDTFSHANNSNFAVSDYNSASDSDTVLLDTKVGSEFSECETSILNGTKPYIENNNYHNYEMLSENEEETVLLSKNTEEDNSEAETSLLVHDNDYRDYDGETILLNQIKDKAQSIKLMLIRNSTGEIYQIAKSETDIGSVDSVGNIVIRNSSISRSHASLLIIGKNVYITDNNSTNGTFVEGVKIMSGEKTQLFNGSLITLGNENFQIFIK